MKVQIVGSCRGAEPLRVHDNELMGWRGEDGLPDETLDYTPVLVALVEVPKADCQYWWTVGEHRADCKPFFLRTAFYGLEEGKVSALTKLEATLTLRRNLPERHVYDQLSRHAAEHGERRLVEKLSSKIKKTKPSFHHCFSFWMENSPVTNTHTKKQKRKKRAAGTALPM